MTILADHKEIARRVIDDNVPDWHHLPVEMFEQPETEIAVAIIFNSVNIISEEQLQAVIRRNISHLLAAVNGARAEQTGR